MGKLAEVDFPKALNGQFEPYRINIRCRCGSRDLEVSETIEASTTWEVKGGLINHQGGVHEFGNAIGTYAQCKRCGHQWTPRRAVQITDLHRPVEIAGRASLSTEKEPVK